MECYHKCNQALDKDKEEAEDELQDAEAVKSIDAAGESPNKGCDSVLPAEELVCGSK